MRADLVNPVLTAVEEVLQEELQGGCTWGRLQMIRTSYTTEPLTALVHIDGAVAGAVLCAMPIATATAVATRLSGREYLLVNKMVLSAVQELCNVIASRASMHLEEEGLRCRVTPPELFVGRGRPVGVNPRLALSIETPCGPWQVQFALETSGGG